MKKLLNFLLVRRTETENKWWHRLFSVLLFGSALIVLVFAILLNVDSSDHTSWVTYKPVAFSLEQNYQQAIGKELLCEEQDLFAFPVSDNEPALNGAGIKCDGVTLSTFDSKRYEALYETARKNLETQFELDKYSLAKCSKPRINGKLSPEEISCMRENLDAWQADPQYPKYQEALKNIAHIKVEREIDFGAMLTDISFWVLVPILVTILWIVFWGAVVYRSILYVIFGRKNNDSSA